MTTSVAMTAQYASGIPTRRASNTDNVAATAVRTACHTDGRFSCFQIQSFIGAIMSSARLDWQALNGSRQLCLTGRPGCQPYGNWCSPGKLPTDRDRLVTCLPAIVESNRGELR